MVKMSSDMSVVGARSQVTGRVAGSGGLRLEGSLSGDVSVTGPVEVGSGAVLEGDVSAASLEVGGKLRGDATCTGGIVVRAGAEVRGELKGSSVSIEPGARLDVRLDTDVTLDLERRR
ncbi:MAG: polymer-forming cytoskeletal protein [Polyangiaceae bacterium]